MRNILFQFSAVDLARDSQDPHSEELAAVANGDGSHSGSHSDAASIPPFVSEASPSLHFTVIDASSQWPHSEFRH